MKKDKLEEVIWILNEAPAWQRRVRKLRKEEREMVTIDRWCQIFERDDRLYLTFREYPPPPSLELAKLIQFLVIRGVEFEILPPADFVT